MKNKIECLYCNRQIISKRLETHHKTKYCQIKRFRNLRLLIVHSKCI